MNGRIPNDGFAAVDAHFVPNMNLKSPIFVIAGTPEMIRKIDMKSTKAIENSPKIRNTEWKIVSIPFCFFSRLLCKATVLSIVSPCVGVRG